MFPASPRPCFFRGLALLPIAALAILSVPAWSEETREVPAVPNFKTEVLPILERHCTGCHGAEKQKAKVRLDTLSPDLLKDIRAAETWHDVRAAINLGEMPPEDEPPLEGADRRVLLDWLNGSIEHAEAVHRSTGGRVVLRRLNRDEYRNTMRDLLGVDLDFARYLPPDGVSVDGMRNNGSALRMSSIQLEYYLDAARDAFDQVLVPPGTPAPEVFRHTFTEKTEGKWPGTQTANRFGRGKKFVARIKDDYPDTGLFRVTVRVNPEFPREHPGAIPRLRVEVGYRPDTLTVEETLGEVDVTPDGPREFTFTGRIENFPLPVRGQGKYPGLAISVANAYDEFEKPKTRTEEFESKGKIKKRTVVVDDPAYPYITVESLEFEGPLHDDWPPSPHRNLIPEWNSESGSEADQVRQVLEGFLPRAWRRPVTSEEVGEMVAFFEQIRPEFHHVQEAIQETLVRALIAPDFLYLLEPGGETKRPLDAFEFASRLSYFLWSTMPDERLFELAESGELLDPKVATAEVDRMIADSRSDAFVAHFTEQWLDLDAMDRQEVDTRVYPKFREEMKEDWRGETLSFFAEILRRNRSAANFLDSDFVMLNDNLARHYGITRPVPGGEFRPVPVSELPEARRGGLLTQAALLLGASTGGDSNLIKRAVFLRERILDDPPAPPPPNVPELKTADPEFARLPIREQLRIHMEDAACADCHRGIDPWGQAMEELGALGDWRTESVRFLPNKKKITLPVDARVTLPDGNEVNGVEELKAYLLEKRKETFARALVVKLTTYALGRTLEFADEAAVGELTRDFLNDDLRLQSMVARIVTSDLFLTK